MFTNQARAIVEDLITPEPYDRFFDHVVGQRPLVVTGGPASTRPGLLGPDPRRQLLDAFATHSATLTCHSGEPSGPPPAARQVADAAAFAALVAEFHGRGYTVRVPEVTDLAEPLRKTVRALELLLRQPVDAVVFWSEAGATAPIHYDEYDLIAIQLSGQKRWFISDAQPLLANEWKRIGEGAPSFESYRTVDVGPGDFIYLPRGTAHTVQSTTESIHVSIGFVPLTLRHAVLAALDHFSDLDRPLRANACGRADAFAGGGVPDGLPTLIRAAIDRLAAAARSDDFLREAVEHKLSRTLADLSRLPAAEIPADLGIDTRLRRTALAAAHLIETPEVIDFSLPGQHILIHRGAHESLRFIAGNAEFQVRDIPGGLDDEVRIALAARLISSGFLEAA